MRLKTWRWLMYDWLNGIWSGIPLCCIKFWCDGNYACDRVGSDPYIDQDDIQYVRCCKCVAKRRRVDIRDNGRIAHFLIRRDW